VLSLRPGGREAGHASDGAADRLPALVSSSSMKAGLPGYCAGIWMAPTQTHRLSLMERLPGSVNSYSAMIVVPAEEHSCYTKVRYE